MLSVLSTYSTLGQGWWQAAVRLRNSTGQEGASRVRPSSKASFTGPKLHGGWWQAAAGMPVTAAPGEAPALTPCTKPTRCHSATRRPVRSQTSRKKAACVSGRPARMDGWVEGERLGGDAVWKGQSCGKGNTLHATCSRTPPHLTSASQMRGTLINGAAVRTVEQYVGHEQCAVIPPTSPGSPAYPPSRVKVKS